MRKIKAERPSAESGRQYHLETGAGDLAERCLLVGSPERAAMIAAELFERPRLVGDHRGLRSFTGRYRGAPVSVVTTGMGGPSIGIVLPEAVRSGARILIRVGTCAALQPDVVLGDSCICAGAVRLDGASDNWAPEGYPAVADWRAVAALAGAAERLKLPHRIGIGVTTACFNEGQARRDDSGYVPPRLLARHDELVRRGALFYSMEEAALFVWCSTHGGLICGAVDAAIANRATDQFRVCGEKEAALIACEALRRL